METATTRFATDAQKGGFPSYLIPETIDRILYADEKMLLNPDAWRAVGKTRGHKYYRDKMISFMTALADDKDINTALEGIE